jgi:hypothetical protein
MLHLPEWRSLLSPIPCRLVLSSVTNYLFEDALLNLLLCCRTK